MAPYDSDSDDDDGSQQGYIETEVLLGYADPVPADSSSDSSSNGDEANETISRLGGQPDWLVVDKAPSSAELARCKVCQALMVLLLQLNGELPDRFPGHERRLYVFACRNKGCRRKAGSMRAIRGVRVDAAAAVSEAATATAKRAKEEAARKAQQTKQVPAPVLGESLFGVAKPFAAGRDNGNPFGGNGNPFGPSTATKNPFSIGGAGPTPTEEKKEDTATKQATETVEKDITNLPRSFAEALSLNSKDSTGRAAPVIEPWPPADAWPKAYPISWISEAEYETLDLTPASAPAQAVKMDMDDGMGGGGAGKEDKYVFESAMDADFQRFADRVSQNPQQVIRYEFAGLPLLYSKDDAVGKVWQQEGAGLPRCRGCGGRRVFEVQLMPHAIGLLEAEELGLEGMDWGTVVVGVCERDCQGQGVLSEEAAYLEEWVGVQWEELVKR